VQNKLRFLLVICLFFSSAAQAFSISSIKFPEDHNVHKEAEVWKFSGKLQTEEGAKYAYVFQLSKKEDIIKVSTHVTDLISKKEALNYHIEQGNVSGKKDKTIQWEAGKAFMRYNLIGDSWTFGVDDEKNGFNFRVKSVSPYVLNSKKSYSAKNMSINGNLTLDGKAIFVTGKDTVFEHCWGCGSLALR